MDSKPGGDFTYAGAFDNAFAGYAAALSHVRRAVVAPLVDQHAPDQENGAWYGNVGLFTSQRAITDMQHGGTIEQEYMGNLPVSQQPQVHLTEPWLADDA